ncbi:non-ribosomal peptide synthetase, partial [[Flexibacter] sp. ATCC 35208]|uniref:non-ribosomal peptide synthetase n=1 Tax=[Flexibacter] sp. ATCC 35208 TaxID=1936242 RepID=UPI0009C9FF07
AEQVSNLHFVPSMLNAFIASVGSDVEQLCRLGSLRKVITSGEALSAETVSHWYSLLPEVPLYNLYGPTEASIDVTAYSTHAGDDRIPIGRPIWNTSMYVLDNHLCLVPEGIAGELYIAGAGLARGYLNRPELTASRFISHPYLNGVRMYRTGDIGRWLPDGNIEYLGRADDQVKIRGYRIELGEIENTLKSFPGIHDAVVIARHLKDTDQELLAYFSCKELIPEATLKDHLAQFLPAYMIPAYFIALEQFPLTSSGKTDRKRLPLPDNRSVEKEHHHMGPRTAVEHQLVKIWEDLLDVHQASVYDDFFELGGHSLKATRLASRIFKEMGVRVGLKDLLLHTVLERQALLISNALKEEYTSIPVIGLKDSYALSAA